MSRLKGEKIEIKTPILKKLIGTKVEYYLKRNIDGRGGVDTRIGVITDIFRKHVDFGNGCLENFSSIGEIAKINLEN